MQFPRTLVEFQDQFPDEEHCWAYLRRARWPRGFICPRWGGRGSHFLASRRLEQCRTCRYQASVSSGTVFVQHWQGWFQRDANGWQLSVPDLQWAIAQ